LHVHQAHTQKMKSPIVPMQHDSLVSEHERESAPTQPLAKSKSTQASRLTNATPHVWLIRPNYTGSERRYILLPTCIPCRLLARYQCVEIDNHLGRSIRRHQRQHPDLHARHAQDTAAIAFSPADIPQQRGHRLMSAVAQSPPGSGNSLAR
jgi:hypothetical protein